MNELGWVVALILLAGCHSSSEEGTSGDGGGANVLDASTRTDAGVAEADDAGSADGGIFERPDAALPPTPVSAGLACDHDAASTTIGIALTEPPYGFSVLPGSERRVFATVTNGVTSSVTWSVAAGDATLSATTGPYIDVTADGAGGHCTTTGTTLQTGVVSSPSTFVVRAQSTEDPCKQATLTFNVCAPPVSIEAVPFYTTLYAHQTADIQALVWGSVDTNVKWAITAQPPGGDGALADTVHRDTVFTGSVAGRYTLTATSEADPTKSVAATVYVTGHAMPYAVTADKTIPVDCTADPGSAGPVYDVGPSQATYHTLSSVPWSTLAAGSTVRVHNEDTTRAAPTTYHEYVQISTQGTASNPIRVCGVPDAVGNLPIVSGQNATTSPNTDPGDVGLGVISLFKYNYNLYGSPNPTPSNIIVEGLSVRQGYTDYSFYPPGSTTLQAWDGFTPAIRVQDAYDVVVRGNDLTDNGQGIFSEAQTPESRMSRDVLVEGNHLHNNGAANISTSHQMYLQALGQVTQFNIIEQFRALGGGANLKSRGVYDIIRYNSFGDAVGQNDLVDEQDSGEYIDFGSYFFYGVEQPAYTADLVVAAAEAWHHAYVYGNEYTNSIAGAPIHFFEDHDSYQASRIGDLWWYNNTFHETPCTGLCMNYRWYLFNTDEGGDAFSRFEWQRIHTFNNIVWMDNPSSPMFYWATLRTIFLDFGPELVPKTWGSNVQTCTDNSAGACDGTGWPFGIPPNPYMDGSNLPAHLSGTSPASFVTATAIPFDPTTFVPVAGSPAIGAGAALPAAIADLPVRFQLDPSTGMVKARTHPLTLGAAE